LVYEYSVAARIGLHWAYLDESFQAIWHRKNPDVPLPPRTIPQDQMNVVLASRAYNAAPKTLSQVHTSTYDLVIHTPETHDAATQLDVTAIWNKLALEITGFYGGESLTNPPDYHWSIGEAGYVDVVNQYAGDAWAYLWALADAKDCFYTRFAQDPMSPTVAREFRRKVLAPGSSMNYTSLIVDFLGRPPNQDAFLKSLGA
jgi:metallopeptidase MepB